MLDLNQLVDISGLFTDPVTFFNLTIATGINENGQIAALGWFRTANANETLIHAFLLTPILQPTINDNCDIGEGANDIKTLTGSFNISTDEITVEMELCAPPDDQIKYRVNFDHTPPFF